MSIRILKSKIVLSLTALLFAAPTFASPPVDLTDYDGGQRKVRRSAKPLTDNDLIFTDNIIKPEKQLHGLVLFKKATVGRTEPKAQGKAVIRFQVEYRARFLQFSKDKKWVAVELLNGRKRSWVPMDAVEILDENYTREAAPPKE